MACWAALLATGEDGCFACRFVAVFEGHANRVVSARFAKVPQAILLVVLESAEHDLLTSLRPLCDDAVLLIAAVISEGSSLPIWEPEDFRTVELSVAVRPRRDARAILAPAEPSTDLLAAFPRVRAPLGAVRKPFSCWPI
jgi:hypothetical protein